MRMDFPIEDLHYDSLDFYYDDNQDYEDSTLWEVYDNCILETLKAVYPLILNIVVYNFIFGIVASTGLLTETLFHILTGVIGLYLINTLELFEGKVILICCLIIAFLLLHIANLVQYYTNIRQSNVTKLSCVIGLVTSEYFLFPPDVWLQIRGSVMILAMKVISLSHDMEDNNRLPNVIQYFGYTCCGSNIMFGPWIPYSDYLNLFLHPTKKSIWWILRIGVSVLLSVFFLIVSNCLSSFIITDNYNRWIIAYIEALTFRTSHYFVCYLSEASMIATGYKNTKIWSNLNKWTFTVTNPLEIEFPSALSNVVINWNRPMHEFLKKYVYRSWLPYGNFAGFLATFVVSSFLHGFELKVSVVLITIGLFSYLQVVPREMISDYISCCVRVRPCKHCNHIYKRDNIRTIIINCVYTLFTMIHLAYLGVLMDPSTDKIGIYEKWSHLHFLSHFIMIVNFLFTL